MTARQRSSAVRWLVGAVFALVVTAISALLWLLAVYQGSAAPAGPRNDVIELRLEHGLGPTELARRLEGRGVIADADLYAIYLRLRMAAGARLRAGRVVVFTGETPLEVLPRVAENAGGPLFRVTIPEGFTRFDIARRLEHYGICDASSFLAASVDRSLLAELGVTAPSAEGYLFPDTYELSQYVPGRAPLERLVRAWHAKAEPVFAEHGARMTEFARTLHWGPHDVLTLASIVEREAAVAEERPMIAAVFLNRLLTESFRPKRLQADPTVSYGCRVAPGRSQACRDFDGRRISAAMQADTVNPYNTYRIDGLPPGPIANPGLDSIRAVLAPERHDYFYFVAAGHGRHRFSTTLEEHNAAVRTP